MVQTWQKLPLTPQGLILGVNIWKVGELLWTAEKINTFFNPHPTRGWDLYAMLNVIAMYSMYVAESDVRDVAPIQTAPIDGDDGDDEDAGDGTDTSSLILFSDDDIYSSDGN